MSWCQNDNYYGWAPLTPRAGFEAGVGFHFGLGNVDASLGLGERDYFFVPANAFLEINLRSSGIRGEERARVYNQTTAANNYTVTNNRVVNEGIPAKTVAAATKRDVKPVAIADHQGKPGEKGTPSKLMGGKLEVFRPAPQARGSVPAADRRELDKRLNQPVTRPGAAAQADPRKADIAARIRERAKTENTSRPNSQRAPETGKNPAAPKPDSDRARIEQAKTERAPQREPNTNAQPESRRPEPKAEPQAQELRRPAPKAEPRNEPRNESRAERKAEQRAPAAPPREESKERK